jgi:hypothetical protein
MGSERYDAVKKIAEEANAAAEKAEKKSPKKS